jgi:hypothetical protein
MKRMLVAALVLGIAVPLAAAKETTDEAGRGKSLAAVMSEYLLVYYTCHKYTGIEQYLAAKSITTNLSERIAGDRNKAVLQIDMLDRKIKSMNPDERLEAQFDKDGLSASARSGTCFQMTEEVKSKFEVEQARNNLL